MLKYGDIDRVIDASIKVSENSEQCHNMSFNNNDVTFSSPIANKGLIFARIKMLQQGLPCNFQKRDFIS